MQLPLAEIWDFMELHQEHEAQWQYALHAGEFHYPDLCASDISLLVEGNTYDPELLPSIFTYREILWQPNVYDQPNLCLPGLKLLEAYCQEYMDQKEENTADQKLYRSLIDYLSGISRDTVALLENDEKPNLAKILGSFRSKAFPIIQFFIWHPRNKPEHVADAKKRLNYTVKILLTQYYKHYSELNDPFWKVTRKPIEEAATSDLPAREKDSQATETSSPNDISPSETT